MTKRLTLILGGARSGKSDFAQALARKRGGDDVLFVATAEARDDEMRARIASHRAARPAAWRTLESLREIARALQSAANARVIVVDCITLWASNVLLADESNARAEMSREVDDLLAWYRAHDAALILVSNEVGMGLVPDNALGRAYRDLLGAVNKKIAAAADEVFLLVAGLPVEIKACALMADFGRRLDKNRKRVYYGRNLNSPRLDGGTKNVEQ
ncbi:MAG: bifunctional adenosylcobinamide kinase/adenosylcobinamide-phosphate guanylyltransferase [Chloroflexi bacterium]|nr:bifunctional adenosylcobinamide kinase/adenosylcobinamide-phosphate guanylyltransferase [Chloroflexota bacterium]